MFRVAKKMIGNNDVALDIVQDVFLSFYNKFSNGHSILYPDSWLYKAVTNKSIDALRHCKKFQHVELTDGRKVLDEVPEKNEEDFATLNKVLSKLKTHEKALVVLYSEGLSYKEMADSTGVNYLSIGKTLSRTLEKIEKELKSTGYEMY
jgi:RNA polymerase sigma-70 factor (ECF subfamily)